MQNKSTIVVLHRIVQKRLGDLFVYLQNVPFREYEYAKANYVCYHSPNIAENHFGRAVRDEPACVVQQTAKTLCRLYPSGIRQNSSNPDPILPWNFGVQMVAFSEKSAGVLGSPTGVNFARF
ncbi:unnamed protein product, partial [Rotaria sp. Silwood1]